MLSSAAFDDTVKAAEQAGIACYLTKPVKQRMLHQCLLDGVGETGDTPRSASPAAPDPVVFRARILIAEDNPVNQEVAQEMLEGLGCEVVVAQDGHAALQEVRETRIDLVLMDCHMPAMDGFEAARCIREREDGAGRLPIIALTADVQKDTESRCLAAGMDAYLSKPFSVQQLTEKLAEWLPVAVADAVADASEAAQVNGVEEVRDADALAQIQALQRPGQPSALGRVIRVYLDSAPQLMDGIRTALEARDAGRLADTAHSLKSSSANLGALGLAELCKRIEGAGREDRLEDAGALRAEADQSFSKTLQALRERLKTAGGI